MKIYRAFIINPISLHKSDYYQDGALVINNSGKIVFCGDYNNLPQEYELIERINFTDKIILPGLIDLHTHLPQYDAISTGRGELLEWLNNYIFPLEAKFADDNFAKEKSDLFFKNVLKAGTTTICVYCSNHKNATDIAFKSAERLGIRAFIGMSMMDNHSYNNLNCDENIKFTEELIKKWHNKTEKLKYIITPRYAGSCSFDLMTKAAELAKNYDLFIQTHLSENLDELNFIKTQFPNEKSYTDIYKNANLLSDKSILAHSIYLNEEELDIIKNHKCNIVHCPTSNRYLQSGTMPLLKYLDNGIQIGLGTDVGAGYSLSILHEAKEAIETSKTFNILHKETKKILHPESALYLATLGAAKILKIDNQVGNFDLNKQADFIVLDNPQDTVINNIDFLSKIIYNSGNYKVMNTFIDGIQVY